MRASLIPNTTFKKQKAKDADCSTGDVAKPVDEYDDHFGSIFTARRLAILLSKQYHRRGKAHM